MLAGGAGSPDAWVPAPLARKPLCPPSPPSIRAQPGPSTCTTQGALGMILLLQPLLRGSAMQLVGFQGDLGTPAAPGWGGDLHCQAPPSRSPAHSWPTRMCGLSRGSRLGSASAAARPSLAMMTRRVRKPRPPTNSTMTKRRSRERGGGFLLPARFLPGQRRRARDPVRRTPRWAPSPHAPCLPDTTQSPGE